MPRQKLSQRFVDRLTAPSDAKSPTTGKPMPALYWDVELSGFGVVVSAVKPTKTYVVQRDLPGGRTRRVTLGPVNVLTLDAARAAAEIVLAEFYQGRDPKHTHRQAIALSALTLTVGFDEYLAGSPKLRPKTIEIYTHAVKNLLRPWLNTPLADIDGDKVVACYRRLCIECGVGSANSAMRVLRSIYIFAADRHRGLPLPHPVRRLRREWIELEPRTGHVRPRELPVWYSAVQGLSSTMASYTLLLLYTGMRRREASRLRWSEIDFADHTIILPGVRIKNGKPLCLPMSRQLEAMLRTRRDMGVDPGGWVFPANSRSGHLETPKAALDWVGRASGVRVTAHDLRRTFATIASRTPGLNQLQLLTISRLLNHRPRGGTVTLNYIQTEIDEMRDPVQRIADEIERLCVGEAASVVAA